MGIFCGKVCKCKKRCKGAFPTNKPLQKGCESICKQNHNLNVADYPCNIAGFQESDFMLTYGYDPCPNNDITIGGVLDPLDTQGQQEQQQKNLQPVIFAVIGLVLLALVVLLFFIL